MWRFRWFYRSRCVRVWRRLYCANIRHRSKLIRRERLKGKKAIKVCFSHAWSGIQAREPFGIANMPLFKNPNHHVLPESKVY
jgi:hypothetical protein